jgi:hypothetical protein
MKARVDRGTEVFLPRIGWRMLELVKKVLRLAYSAVLDRDLHVMWDKRLLREIEEYFQLNESQAKSMCKLLGTPNAMLWAAIDPKAAD